MTHVGGRLNADNNTLLRVVSRVAPSESELKRNGIRRFSLVLGHEVNVPLRRASIQMPHERSDLIPSLPLSHKNRNERMTQGVVTVEPFECSVLDQFLEESIRPVTPSLLALGEPERTRFSREQMRIGLKF